MNVHDSDGATLLVECPKLTPHDVALALACLARWDAMDCADMLGLTS